jgi:hypothetical protein
VLVTMPPAKMRTAVDAATSAEKKNSITSEGLCGPGPIKS